MIDLHSHILFDVDDGPTSLEESLRMVRMAAEDGTRVLVATPHQHHPSGYHVPPDLAKERFAVVAAAVAAEGIEIDLRLAAEIHFSGEIPEGLREGRLTPLSEGGRYFLFELPVTSVPGTMNELVFHFQMAGHFPVLAHPERNFEVMERPEIAERLRERGVLMQITAMSVTGEFGRKSEKAARRLLKRGVVDVIASDAHNAGRRPPGLSRAVKVAARYVGAEAAERMVTVTPERILRGEGVA